MGFLAARSRRCVSTGWSSSASSTSTAAWSSPANGATTPIDFLDDAAVFSIFRRTSEMPMFRVEKRPKLRARQGQYAVIAAFGQILKRGHDLAAVLRVFDRKLLKAMMVE